MSRTIIIKSNYMINSALKVLCDAISEHKWKDALEVMPIVVALSKHNIPVYYLWKVLHVLMVHLHIPQNLQIRMLFIVFSSSLKNYEAALSWIADSFSDVDEENFEKVFDAVKVSYERTVNYSSANLCQAFYSLYYYVQWKQKYYLCKEAREYYSGTDKEEAVHIKMKECVSSGVKVRHLLQKSFLLFKHEASSQNTKMEKCEWLLGPYLDIEELLVSEGYNMTSGKSHKYKSLEGLELIQEYVIANPDHLPGLCLFYNYISLHHRPKKQLKKDILRKIVRICPQNSLVINYVNIVLEEVETQIKKSEQQKIGGGNQMEDTDDDNIQNELEKCQLFDADIDCVLECIDLLCKFLEFFSNRRNENGWHLLTIFLQKFHLSWISCWNCCKCVESRAKLKELSLGLSMWPLLFWNSDFISDPELNLHCAYSSYIFGYGLEFLNDSLRLRGATRHQKSLFALKSMVNEKGMYSRDFNVYLDKLRKRWLSKNSSPSDSFPESNLPELEVLPPKRILHPQKFEVKFSGNNNNINTVKYFRMGTAALSKTEKRKRESDDGSA